MEQVVSETVDEWIAEEEGSKGGFVRVIRANDPWAGMSEEEIEDVKEFIRWYINKDYAVLLMIPTHPRETDVWFSDEEEFRTSAFNTHDFEALRQPFNKYGYRMKKILARIKDLAIMYSCLTAQDGREDTLRKYENLVDSEFREKLRSLVVKCQIPEDRDEKMLLKAKIAKVSQNIMKCKAVWQKYSSWE